MILQPCGLLDEIYHSVPEHPCAIDLLDLQEKWQLAYKRLSENIAAPGRIPRSPLSL